MGGISHSNVYLSESKHSKLHNQTTNDLVVIAWSVLRLNDRDRIVIIDDDCPGIVSFEKARGGQGGVEEGGRFVQSKDSTEHVGFFLASSNDDSLVQKQPNQDKQTCGHVPKCLVWLEVFWLPNQKVIDCLLQKTGSPNSTV